MDSSAVGKLAEFVAHDGDNPKGVGRRMTVEFTDEQADIEVNETVELSLTGTEASPRTYGDKLFCAISPNIQGISKYL